MLLCVDIGNTNITFGLFKGEDLYMESRLDSNRTLTQEEYELKIKQLFIDEKISGIVIASVVDELTNIVKNALSNIFSTRILVINSSIKTGVKLVSQNNSEIGADRIANACALLYKYATPSVAIDFGTATTFDIVNSNGEFCGGIILPGVKTQLKSLQQSTSKLPNFEIEDVNYIYGSNTKEAILSGVIKGCAYAIDGLMNKIREEFKDTPPIFIGTGGYCNIISKYMNNKFYNIDPILTLRGLVQLYKLNS